jgi:hypothetical protein
MQLLVKDIKTFKYMLQNQVVGSEEEHLLEPIKDRSLKSIDRLMLKNTNNRSLDRLVLEIGLLYLVI